MGKYDKVNLSGITQEDMLVLQKMGLDLVGQRNASALLRFVAKNGVVRIDPLNVFPSYLIAKPGLEGPYTTDLTLRQLSSYEALWCTECETLCARYDQGLSCNCEDGRRWLTEKVHRSDYPSKWTRVSVTIKSSN